MLSERLKSLRTKRNITQSDLAKRIGVARTTYAMYEQGQREPDYDTLQKIADYFDVSIDYLLGRTENKKTESSFDPEFEAWLSDPRASKLYKEFNESDEERREMLFAMWEVIKSQNKK